MKNPFVIQTINLILSGASRVMACTVILRRERCCFSPNWLQKGVLAAALLSITFASASKVLAGEPDTQQATSDEESQTVEKSILIPDFLAPQATERKPRAVKHLQRPEATVRVSNDNSKVPVRGK